jgi:pentose-5-phosphate-3-epimerase
LAKIEAVRAQWAGGVDGGVGEGNIERILAAGTSYVVVGRRLFTRPEPKPQRTPQ